MPRRQKTASVASLPQPFLIMKRLVCLNAKRGLGRFTPSTFPHYHDVNSIAGKLACHHLYRGRLPPKGLWASATACTVVRISVVCASSGDDQTMVAPTVIVSFSSCCIRLLFYSFETNLLFSTMATQAPFRTMFFSSTSYMKFTDSSVLPLQFSLQRQPRYASSI